MSVDLWMSQHIRTSHSDQTQNMLYTLYTGPGELSTEACHALNSWIIKVNFPADAKDFSLLHSIQTDSEAHPAPYPMEIGS
jgi:hypothetical protein